MKGKYEKKNKETKYVQKDKVVKKEVRYKVFI
jgi:hypothetical protein